MTLAIIAIGLMCLKQQQNIVIMASYTLLTNEVQLLINERSMYGE